MSSYKEKMKMKNYNTYRNELQTYLDLMAINNGALKACKVEAERIELLSIRMRIFVSMIDVLQRYKLECQKNKVYGSVVLAPELEGESFSLDLTPKKVA
jgi:hypothetical protein